MIKKLIMILAGAGVLAITPVQAQQRFVTIGTGGVTGVYYAAGGAICRLVNKDRAEHGIRCSVESTGGSVFNINTMRAGEMDIGVVQSDIQYNATEGLAQFKGDAFSELRAVFALHPEPITLLAAKDAGIRGVRDLAGKRVNVGPPGSGTQVSVGELFDAVGVKMSDLALKAELKPDEQGAALCDGNIHAFFYTVGHPSANIQDPTTTCGAQLVSLTGPAVERLIESKSYYSPATIPAGLYPGNDTDTRTYGVRATLVTTSNLPADVVYTVVKSVFDNFEEFKRLHPALAILSPDDMIANGLSAPLHEGAARYYKEKGWIE